MRRDLLQRGYRIVRALQIDGIPYLFGERELLTVLGAAAGAPAGYTMSHALSLDDGAELSQDCDRQSGFAAASEIRYLLGRQQLEDEGLNAALFSTPTTSATLTVAVTSPSTTTFTVDTTSSFASSGGAYIGRERFTYSGKTGTTFTGITRGVCGLAHYHTADTASAYSQITDTPIYWRGRLVTVWAHLVSPEGRYLGTDWCTLGDYCWQEWRGEIVETPKPTAVGFEMRVGSLVRKAAGKVGATVKGTVAADSAGVPLIYYTPSDSLRVREVGGGLDVEGAPSQSRIASLTDWCAIVQTNLNAGAGSDELTVRPGGSGVRVSVDLNATADFSVVVEAQSTAWFLDRDARDALYIDGVRLTVPLIWNTSQDTRTIVGGWVVVELEPSVDYTDAGVPATGLILVTVGGDIEVMRYDEVATGFDGRFTAFRIAQRRVNGTFGVNPWTPGSSVALVSAEADAISGIAWTLWVSSGMAGARGVNDTLSFGYGLGIPQDWIDEDSFRSWHFEVIESYIAEEVDIEETLGGHFALRRQCLIQSTGSDGEHKLRLVSTEVIDDPGATVLSVDDVLIDGVDEPEMMEAPNHIRIDASIPGQDSGRSHVARDAARAQAEGKIEWSLAAPGISLTQALERGAMLIVLSDGQQAVRVRMPPWVSLEIGDAVSLETEHPALYDYSSGSWAPSTIMGRVVGLRVSQVDETREATILLSGQYGGTLYLAPCAEVTTAVSSTVLRVSKGSVERFEVGDTIAIYLPGSEGTDYEEGLIDAIDTSNASYDVVTLDAALAVVTPAAGLVLTWPQWGSANTRQRRYMYDRADKIWS